MCLQDGYALDDWGIHHRVLNAVVETQPGTDCHGIIDVFRDRLELRGSGAMVSAVMHARFTRPNRCINSR
jgi:manganese-dependent ADP-ribose/CDP-alcohol diphosphatase